ncbi:MAG: hypothetical protein IKE94_04860 [Aeriscardovia sp.]|nr:hypothetical protein [Aeriscardovia sp.]
MRAIDADELSKRHPMAGYYGYKQADIDEMETLDMIPRESIRGLGNDLRTFRDGIGSESALIGFNAAIALCNKWLGGFDEQTKEK